MPNENEDIFRVLRSSKSGFKRLLALLCKEDVPVAGLTRASHSLDWVERAAVADNRLTPEKTLRQLSEDGDSIVRLLALNNLSRVEK